MDFAFNLAVHAMRFPGDNNIGTMAPNTRPV
ncbi:MAG: hypothetical protein CFH40_01805, partial [Alphaproteobacteria bacterium MarineAlpha10_Bin3]